MDFDGDYLGAYRRFFVEFVERMNPDDQLPVKVTSHDVTEAELVGEVIDMTLQYLNQKYCPPSLQSYMAHLVIQEIKAICQKQPENCGMRPQENTYAPLKLMQAVTGKVNEICQRYLENSRLALLPPPPSTPFPLTTVSAIKNTRRKMEDRHVIIHDLNTIFNIQDDSSASYYAVFDGHAGQEAAVYCAAHLHQYLAESNHYPTDPERALHDAFVTTDAHFIQKSTKHALNSGATAVCALIMNKKLYVAWAGDSQVALAKRGDVTQLVNPHRPDRMDERYRVEKMGGTVMHFETWRVDGCLGVSRAIGDAQYKPYVTSAPEIKCLLLDGTEDFLVVACDGLWDYVDEDTAAELVYQQVRHDPYNIESVSQRLIKYSKEQGSSDNITVIVVFLTAPFQIAARSSHSHPLAADVKLNNMEPDNRYLSTANGQFNLNSSIVKPRQNNGAGFDDEDSFVFGKPTNGKHENGAVNYGEEDDDEDDDDEDDDENENEIDLGPETNVDAVDDAGEICNIANVSRELFPDKESNDPFGVVENDPNKEENENNSKKNEIIGDADNVGDSEDSEDEWNYYRVDSNKEKKVLSAPTESAESNQTEFEKSKIELDENQKLDQVTAESLEDLLDCKKEREQEFEEKEKEAIDSSSDSSEDECDKEDIIPTKVVDDTRSVLDQPEESTDSSPTADSTQPLSEDMEFQLNPNAAEFIPVSPPMLPIRILDVPISGSPLKQAPGMDNIRLPSPKEFKEGASHCPGEIDEKENDVFQSNGDNSSPELPDRQRLFFGLDESEASSTRAEFGDESTASFLTATDLHTTGGFDTSVLSTCENLDADPMTLSLSKPVDLNAVHDLSDTDLIVEENGNEQVEDSPHFEEKEDESGDHPELADLISPDSDQPKHSIAFPDHHASEMFGAPSPIEEVKHDSEVQELANEVAAMNLANSQQNIDLLGQEDSPKNCEETSQNLGHLEDGIESKKYVDDFGISGKGDIPETVELFGNIQAHHTMLMDLMSSENFDKVDEFVMKPQEPNTPKESSGNVDNSSDFEFKFESNIGEGNELVKESNLDLSDNKQSPIEPEHITPIESTESQSENVEEKIHKAQVDDILTNPIETENLVMKLSESLQEFTGLEKQFEPLEAHQEVSKTEETKTEEIEALRLEKSFPEDTLSNQIPKEIEMGEKTLGEIVPENISIPSIIVPEAALSTKIETKAKPIGVTKSTAPKTSIKSVKTDGKSTLKATPTSPIKTTSPRTTSAVGVAAKKTPTRPKTAEVGPKVTTATTAKTGVARTLGTKPASTIAPKPRTTTTTSAARPSTVGARNAEKKVPATNGDVKTAVPKTKPAAKPLVKPSTTTTARPLTASTLKPRVTATTTSAKTSTSTATSKLSDGKTQRPKTAPTSLAVPPRTTKVSSVSKSPVIDKQIKETANKQISSSRKTSTISSVTKTSRTTATTTTSSTLTAKRVSAVKTTTTTATGVKKPAGTTRTSTKSATTVGKSATAVTNQQKTATKVIIKPKIQNGDCKNKDEQVVVQETISNEENDLKKDSPILQDPTQNHLLISVD